MAYNPNANLFETLTPLEQDARLRNTQLDQQHSMLQIQELKNKIQQWQNEANLRKAQRAADIAKARKEEALAPVETEEDIQGFIQSQLARVQDEAGYNRARVLIEKISPEAAATLPDRYDPAFVESYIYGDPDYLRLSALERQKKTADLIRESMKQERSDLRNQDTNAARIRAAEIRAAASGSKAGTPPSYSYNNEVKMSNSDLAGTVPKLVLDRFDKGKSLLQPWTWGSEADDDEIEESRGYLSSRINEQARTAWEEDTHKYNLDKKNNPAPLSISDYKTMAKAVTLGNIRYNVHSGVSKEDLSLDDNQSSLFDRRLAAVMESLPEAIAQLPDGPYKNMLILRRFNDIMTAYLNGGQVSNLIPSFEM